MRNNLAFSAYYNSYELSETLKEQSEKGVIAKKASVQKKGAIVYATHHQLSLFLNFNKPLANLDDLSQKEIPL